MTTETAKAESQLLIEQLREAIKLPDSELEAAVRLAAVDAHASDLAEILHLLSDEDRSRVIFSLPPSMAAEVIILLSEDVRGDVVDELEDSEVAEMVSELSPDDAAYVLGELSDERYEQVLEHIPDDIAAPIEKLMEYGQYTAGGIMTTDVVAVPSNKTVRDAVDFVREASHDEDLYEIYVVDPDGRLIGELPLRRLVTNPPDTKIERIYDRDPFTVRAEDEQEVVLRIIRKYDLSSVAVVDGDGMLLGRITHDDLQDVAREEAEEDLLRMGGTDPAELESASVFRAARIRLTWLMPCMLGMLITAGVIEASKEAFDTMLFAGLVVFVPLIGAMGGNSGVQSATIIVRGLATGELAASSWTRALRREIRISLAMAPLCGFVAWLLVAVLFPFVQNLMDHSYDPTYTYRVAKAVGLAMTFAIVVSTMLGVSLPFLFRRLGVDPAICSGPLVTTANDFLCVGIYMIAAMMLAR